MPDSHSWLILTKEMVYCDIFFLKRKVKEDLPKYAIAKFWSVRVKIGFCMFVCLFVGVGVYLYVSYFSSITLSVKLTQFPKCVTGSDLAHHEG